MKELSIELTIDENGFLEAETFGFKGKICESELKELLKAEGVDARVVSMPCQELFDKQSKKYKESVIPSKVRARVCVEAGSTLPWFKYAGLDGKVIGINEFGMSGPYKTLFNHYGFTAENVKNAALEIVK